MYFQSEGQYYTQSIGFIVLFPFGLIKGKGKAIPLQA
jgi:hypothetical protein